MNLGERGSGSRRAKSASRPSCFSKFRSGMSPASLTMRPPSGVAVTCCRPMLQKVSCLGHPVAIILSLLAVPSAFTAATWTPSEALCSEHGAQFRLGRAAGASHGEHQDAVVYRAEVQA